jgi:hypothetical protein
VNLEVVAYGAFDGPRAEIGGALSFVLHTGKSKAMKRGLNVIPGKTALLHCLVRLPGNLVG